MNTNKYLPLIKELLKEGETFKKSGFLFSDDTKYNKLAKSYGYRKPENGYFGRGTHFYLLLRRIYMKAKETKQI